MSVSDQRKNKRFELRLPFELIREGASPRQETGETLNMSSAGVLFSANVELKIGSPIEYRITLQPTNDGDAPIRLRCMGKVVRRQDGVSAGSDEDSFATAATLERYEFVRADRN